MAYQFKKMNRILALFVSFLILASCSRLQNGESMIQDDEIGKFVTLQDDQNPSITQTGYKTNNASIPSKWKNISEIEGVWTSLQKDDSGYLVYYPANGTIPQILVKELTITINWWLEGQHSFRITGSKLEDKKILIDAVNDEGTKASFTVSIYNQEKKMVLWNWVINWPVIQGGQMNYQWLTTPKVNETAFRLVNNSINNPQKLERQFQPIEIN